MNISVLEAPGYEADDIIGSVSRICEENNIKCIILTGDKDDLQLATKNTIIKLIITKGGANETVFYDEDIVYEKYTVSPSEFIDVKALMGDSSDNIPGVSGIGEKTAITLINKYKSIENIYNLIDELECSQKIKEKLKNDKEMAFLSKDLATINRFVPGLQNIEEMDVKPFKNDELYDLLFELDLTSIITRLNLNKTEVKNNKNFKKVDFEELNIDKKIYYILDKKDEDIKGFSISADGVEYSYVEFGIENNPFEFFEKHKCLFENSEIKKIGYNTKEDSVFLKKLFDIDLNGVVFDAMIACYINDPSRSSYNLPDIIKIILNIDTDDYMSYSCYLKELHEKFNDIFKEKNQLDLYYNIELPLSQVLASMEINGMYVDKETLEEFSKKLTVEISEVTKNIYKLAGEEFNINSPKQLGVILFEKLNLPVVKKTKTGYSTNIEVLESLKDSHEIINEILNYRMYTKLKSTYVDGLINVIEPQTGRIYSTFNQTVTTTGRISSTEPNLQNIPVRYELGREIRKIFVVPSDDYVFVDADYSQIELRIFAHLSKEPALTEAFNNHIDIHTKTAMDIFKGSKDEVTKNMRRQAKAVNFGILYGISPYGLAEDLGISPKEAKKFIESNGIYCVDIQCHEYGDTKVFTADINAEDKIAIELSQKFERETNGKLYLKFGGKNEK